MKAFPFCGRYQTRTCKFTTDVNKNVFVFEATEYWIAFCITDKSEQQNHNKGTDYVHVCHICRVNSQDSNREIKNMFSPEKLLWLRLRMLKLGNDPFLPHADNEPLKALLERLRSDSWTKAPGAAQLLVSDPRKHHKRFSKCTISLGDTQHPRQWLYLHKIFLLKLLAQALTRSALASGARHCTYLAKPS